MNLLFGQVMLADLCRIDEPIDEMATMADGIEATRPEGIDLYWALRIATATLRGDLIECEQRYVAHVQRCVTRDQIHGAAASVLIYPLLLRGSPQAAPIAHASLASLAASDTFLATPIAQGGLTLVQAAAGELAAAESTCSTIDETHARDLLLAPFVGRS